MQLGLIGENISYSLSPVIHYFASKLLHLPCAYKVYDLSQEEVAGFLQDFWQQGGLGLNVTRPYKRLVASLLPEAGASVNTLVRGEKTWRGTSTDGEGFARGIARMGAPLSFYREVVILGAGGVVSALLPVLGSETRAKKVTILRRRPWHDDGLAEIAGHKLRVEFYPFQPELLQQLLAKGRRDVLLIQASSAPQNGDNLAAFCPALEGYEGAFCDLIYQNPSELWRLARKKKIPCQDGLAMLIEQARLAQQLWWGQSAPYEAILEHLKAHLAGEGASK